MNSIHFPDNHSEDMRKDIRALLIGIQITLIAWGYLILASIMVSQFFFKQQYKSNTLMSDDVMILYLILNIIIIIFQITLLMKHYAPKFGLKQNVKFEYDEKIKVEKRESYHSNYRERKKYKIFIWTYILFLLSILLTRSMSDLYLLLAGICFFVFYLVHTYIAFTGKYYVLDLYADKKKEEPSDGKDIR